MAAEAGGEILPSFKIARCTSSLSRHLSRPAVIITSIRGACSEILYRKAKTDEPNEDPDIEPEAIAFGSDVPLGRTGQPNEVAPCYVFLASDDSSYMTGQVLHPNGGEIING